MKDQVIELLRNIEKRIWKACIANVPDKRIELDRCINTSTNKKKIATEKESILSELIDCDLFTVYDFKNSKNIHIECKTVGYFNHTLFFTININNCYMEFPVTEIFNIQWQFSKKNTKKPSISSLNARSSQLQSYIAEFNNLSSKDLKKRFTSLKKKYNKSIKSILKHDLQEYSDKLIAMNYIYQIKN